MLLVAIGDLPAQRRGDEGAVKGGSKVLLRLREARLVGERGSCILRLQAERPISTALGRYLVGQLDLYRGAWPLADSGAGV